MNIDEVIKALVRVRCEMNNQKFSLDEDTGFYRTNGVSETKGGYFRVGNIAIKISEITELK